MKGCVNEEKNIAECFAKLDDRYKKVFIMNIEGYSHFMIALRYFIRISTVRKRIDYVSRYMSEELDYEEE